MATTADLAEIVDLARRRQWRLVLVGDPAQLPARRTRRRLRPPLRHAPHHHLKTPRRFHQPWEAAASLALRAGDPHVAEIYDEHGRLSTVHPALVPDRVLDLLRRHERSGQTVAITTNTAETARRINRTIQASRPTNGSTAALADGTHARAGDVIATRRNDRTLTTDQDRSVRNRQTWTVTEVALYVTHPERGTAKLPADYVRHNVELGWAVTGYGNQGDTVDVGVAVLEPGTTRNHLYVAMTRGRRTNVALLVDGSGTGNAANGLTAIIERRPQEGSAFSTRRRLQREAAVDLLADEDAAPKPPIPATDPMRARPAELDRRCSNASRGL